MPLNGESQQQLSNSQIRLTEENLTLLNRLRAHQKKALPEVCMSHNKHVNAILTPRLKRLLKDYEK